MMAEGEAEQFSLRWNNFHSNLTAGFHALLQGEDLVDVTLAADGQFIRAHKIVLSVCSPYFKELFKVNPCKHPIVILKDVSHKDLVAILQFMYQGEVNVRQEELTTFLKTAEMLQIKGLTGDDSVNEEETLPVPPAPVQRPRVVRRVMEKAPHAARATVEKKQQPAAELLTVEPEEAPAQPPFKRIRPEVSTASPVVTEETVTPSRSSASIDFVEISKPKMEPVEFETEIEEIESTPSNRDDPLVQLLGGESSQSMQDSSQGTGLFASIPGVSQDSGLSQDSGQGVQIVRSAKGNPVLIYDGFVYSTNQHRGRKIFWVCSEYKKEHCTSRCVTDGEILVKPAGPHNHLPRQDKLLKNLKIDAAWNKFNFEDSISPSTSMESL